MGLDSDVPPSLVSIRNDLMARRDKYLEREAEENRCLKEDEATIRVIDQLLCAQPQNWKELVAYRTNRTGCINNHHGDLALLHGAIVDVDKSLCWVEDRIKFYANLK